MQHYKSKTLRILICGTWALAALVTQAADISVKSSAFEYADNGLLVKETIEPGNPADCLKTSYEYDSFGNKRSTATWACSGSSSANLASASTPRTSSVQYESLGRFVAITTNALGQSETKEYDSRFGAVSKLTGPNGLSTSWSYDAFGRKVRETRSDGSYGTWEYLLCTQNNATCPGPINGVVSQWSVTEVQYTGSGAILSPPKTQFYDDSGRILRAQTLAFDGSGSSALIGQDTHYDAQGRVARRSTMQQLIPADAPQYVTYEYDALDRVVREISPDPDAPGGAAVMVTEYNALTTVLRNAAGQTKTTVRTAQGLVSSVTDAAGQQINYVYDVAGQLLATQAGGVVTSMTYNKRGQKVAMQDPSMGSWLYTYNIFGELVSQRDSTNQVTSMAYDVLGRMTQRTEPDLISYWSYDRKANGSACGKSVGKLCEAWTNNDYRRIHNYDALGRNDSTSTVMDNAASPAVVSVSFDEGSRVVSKTWPTGFQAFYAYSPLGFLKQISSGGTNGFATAASMEVLAMDPNGRVTQFRQGTKVVTQRNYDSATGRLRGQVATTDGQAVGNVTNHAYSYDALGNMASRTDYVTGTQENFSYDNLNRLTMYMLSSGAVSPQAQTQVMYDARGNIIYKSDVGRYWYDQQRPTRMTNITLETAPGAVVPLTGTQELAYAFGDYGNVQSVGGVPTGNGNLLYMAGRDVANNRHIVRKETYTSFNMPQAILYGNFLTSSTSTADRALSFVYGPEHQRVRQQVELTSNAPSRYQAGTTWYLNGEDSQGLTYEKEIKTNGVTEHRHFLSAGGMAFGIFVSRSGNLNGQGASSITYLNQDHLGSVSAISDQNGNVIERMAYDPWGKRRNVNGLTDPLDTLVGANTDRGYTMHEHLDEIGVVHMNGRIYDPLNARFMSGDPFIQSAYDLQSYNRYSYVFNNPMSLTDPTGYFSVKKLLKVAVVVAVAYYTGQWIGGSLINAAGFTGTAFATAGTPAVAGTLTGLGGAVAGAGGGFAAGVVGSGTLKGGLQGAITGAAFGYVGGEFAANTPGNYAGHAAVGCGSALMAGGECATGAVSAFASKWATVNTNGDFFSTVVVGGTISAIGGGKFSNGASSAAFGYLFNQMLSRGAGLRGLISAPVNDPLDPETLDRRGGRGFVNLDRLISRADDTGPQEYQYSLIAQRDGMYPNERTPGIDMYMNAGDTWKIGTSMDPDARYSGRYLRSLGVDMVVDATGSRYQVWALERLKLLGYMMTNFNLPPGNKMLK